MFRAGLVVGIAVAALTFAAAAAASTPASTREFAASLKVEVKAKFKTQAPALTLESVTCSAAKRAEVYHCLAHFLDKGAKADVVYHITASTKHSKTLTGGVVVSGIDWTTTQQPSCTLAATHTPIQC